MNITTLNVVSLDDGRILKKGGATPNPPSGEETFTYYKAPEGGISILGDLVGTSIIKLNILNGAAKCVTTMANSFALGGWEAKDVEAVAVSSTSPIFKAKLNMGGTITEINSVDEVFAMYGDDYAWKNWEQITEAEFYNLE